jgi:REP element-mobilizing transposase RayT
MGRQPEPGAWRQMGLQAQHKWGGIREHSGRPKASKPRGHLPRPGVSRHQPLHVTMRVAVGRPNLRRHRLYRTLRACFRKGRERFGFRLVHFNVLGNHLHLICEADDRRALSRGVQGLAIRIARNVNRADGRRGKLFAERYHLHVLETPREVRNTLRYVLRNGVRHGVSPAGPFFDVYSSAVYFDGWKEPSAIRFFDDGEYPVVAPRAWLLTTGWRRHGLISFAESPAAAG